MTTSSRLAFQTIGPLIDGELQSSECGVTAEVINPSDGSRCGMVPVGCESDVTRAVVSAKRAFESGDWDGASPAWRKRVLHRWADMIASEAEILDALDATEMGKPVNETFCNALASAGLMRFFAEASDKLTGRVYGSDATSFVVHRLVPRGVVAAVTPWNFPTYVAVLKIAPALAAGNCVVLKPSELSSQSAIRLAKLAVEAGLPPGVLNVVPGLGENIGRALGLHGLVDMVTFTGSTEVGKCMMQYAGQSNLKVVLAECGGKSPHIMFDDGVDLDLASDSVAKFLVTNQGQVCSVGSRLLVPRSIEAEVVERVISKLRNIVMGSALDPRTTFGPLASAKQCARVLRYIKEAESQGARLAFGGQRVMLHTGGYFVEPTVFSDVDTESPIAQEEVFGPVLSVIPFNDEADAVRIANKTIYGLAAYVWTADLSRGLRMMKALRASVRINATAVAGEGAGHSPSHEPANQSGIGVEGGLGGMESYMRRQRVWFNHA